MLLWLLGRNVSISASDWDRMGEETRRGQMRLLGHLQGGTCGVPWTETKMD